MNKRRFLPLLFAVLSFALSGCEKQIDVDGFKVTWLNDDGSVLKVEHDVTKGSMPSFDYVPTSTKGYGNVFLDWSPSIQTVYSDQVYTATYYDLENPTPFHIYYENLFNGENSPFNPSLFYYGDYINLYIPTRVGHEFLGWTDEKGNMLSTVDMYGNIVTILNTTQLSDIYVYAKWATQQYTVHYFCYLDENYIDQYYTRTANTYFSARAYDVSGYEFEGFYVNGMKYTSSSLLDIYVTSDLEIELVYKEIELYQIHYFCYLDENCFDEYYEMPYYSTFRAEAADVDGYEIEGFYVNGMLWSSSNCIDILVTSDLEIKLAYKEIDNFIYSYNFDTNSYEISGYHGNDYYLYIPEEHNGLPVTAISSNAFKECTSISCVYLPDNIEFVGDYAFDHSSIEAFYGGSGLKSFGSAPFLYCTSLFTLDLSGCYDLHELPSNFACYCSNLTNLYLPEEIYTIDYFAFAYSGIYQFIGNEYLTYIGPYAFTCCSNLNSINLEQSYELYGIPEYFANYSRNITSIKLPPNLETIGTYAFGSLNNSLSISLPSSVNYVESYGFYDCPYLTIYLHYPEQASLFNPNWAVNVYQII